MPHCFLIPSKPFLYFCCNIKRSLSKAQLLVVGGQLNIQDSWWQN